jgi:hypothetical protein
MTQQLPMASSGILIHVSPRVVDQSWICEVPMQVFVLRAQGTSTTDSGKCDNMKIIRAAESSRDKACAISLNVDIRDESCSSCPVESNELPAHLLYGKQLLCQAATEHHAPILVRVPQPVLYWK